MTAVRVVLADDHALVRGGIRSLLQASGVAVVGEAGEGHEALALVDAVRPDLVLLDIALPGLNGLEVAERLRAGARVRVVILSMHGSRAYVQRALAAGVDGYVLKDATGEDLARAVAAVMRGERYLSPAVAEHVEAAFTRGGAGEPVAPALSPRQREVLQMLAEGLPAKEIAFRLGIGAKTVETHRAAVMDRLGIHDVAGLVRYAIREGLVTAD